MKHSPAFLKLVGDAKTRIKQTTPEEVKTRMDGREQFHLVVIREDHEWSKGHIVGAIHRGKGMIERDIEVKIPNHKAEIILYCGGGYRSALSADNLQRMGYKNVFSMDGGWRQWKQFGYPTE